MMPGGAGAKRGLFFCCGVIFLTLAFLLGTGTALFAQEDNPPERASAEKKEKAMQESILQAAQKSTETSAGEKKNAAGGLTEKAATEAPAKEEEAPFFIAENIRWGGGEDKAFLEIVGEEEVLPAGTVDAGPDGLSLRWRPSKPLVIKMKKNNPVDSTLLQQVLFRENPTLTKKFALEAPYYVLDEIVLSFGAPVSYNVMQDGNWFSLEILPQKAEEPEASEVQEGRKAEEIPMPETTSPADILGSFFEAKELYEAYVLGGGRGMADLFKKARGGKKVSAGFFDGSEGFPKDMKPVFKEAYPRFGTPEYWKRHIRAVARQTFGYSSDFDGTYGSWGGTSVKDRAFTMQPDLDVMYNGLGFGKPFYGSRKPTGSLDLGYKGGKIFPVSEKLGFGDGLRSQTVTWGGNYRPNKRYAFSSQNTIRLFGGKTLTRSSRGDIIRSFRKGYRLTNAGGFNYRLTKRILWKNGVGLERTLSDANDGRSRDLSAFLTTGVEQSFSKRLQGETVYSYRHLYYDKEPYRKPIPYTKAKDIHSLSEDLRYKISNRCFLNGGPEFYIIDSDIFKFGGHARLRYQWRPQDQAQAEYDNGVVQDGSGKIAGGLTTRGGNSSSIVVSRFERVRLSYWHAIGAGVNPRTKLAFSAEYRRNVPLSGVYGQQITNDDGFNLQASWIRKLRGGLTWLELTYRFSTYRSKAADSRGTTDLSIHEHAVFFVIRNYFGEWGEVT